jgi:hypothetical protein
MTIQSREAFIGEPKKEKFEPKKGETWRDFFQSKLESYLAENFSGLSRIDVTRKTPLRKQALEGAFKFYDELLKKVEDQEIRKNFSGDTAATAEIISDAIAGYVKKKEESEEAEKKQKAEEERKKYFERFSI